MFKAYYWKEVINSESKYVLDNDQITILFEIAENQEQVIQLSNVYIKNIVGNPEKFEILKTKFDPLQLDKEILEALVRYSDFSEDNFDFIHLVMDKVSLGSLEHSIIKKCLPENKYSVSFKHTDVLADIARKIKSSDIIYSRICKNTISITYNF